jgi:hypothetical protein
MSQYLQLLLIHKIFNIVKITKIIKISIASIYCISRLKMKLANVHTVV